MDKRDEMLKKHWENFISKRVMDLAWEGEQRPECQQEKESMREMREQAEAALGYLRAEELISAARNIESPVHEFIYQIGLWDGARIARRFFEDSIFTQ